MTDRNAPKYARALRNTQFDVIYYQSHVGYRRLGHLATGGFFNHFGLNEAALSWGWVNTQLLPLSVKRRYANVVFLAKILLCKRTGLALLNQRKPFLVGASFIHATSPLDWRCDHRVGKA